MDKLRQKLTDELKTVMRQIEQCKQQMAAIRKTGEELGAKANYLQGKIDLLGDLAKEKNTEVTGTLADD